MAKILLLKNDRIGEDENGLGNKLINGALSIAYDEEKKIKSLETIVLINRGVLLATRENEMALEALKNLSNLGIEVLMCATCVEHFNLKDLEVGEVVSAKIIMPLILQKEVVSL